MHQRKWRWLARPMDQLELFGNFGWDGWGIRRSAERPMTPDSHKLRVNIDIFRSGDGTWIGAPSYS